MYFEREEEAYRLEAPSAACYKINEMFIILLVKR